MTVTRGTSLLAMLAALAVAVIALRCEQARVAAEIEGLAQRRVALRAEAWMLEVEISRLRTPEQIARRVADWSLGLSEPRPGGKSGPAAESLAAR